MLQNSILGLRLQSILRVYPNWFIQKVHQKSGAKPSNKGRSAKICSSIPITEPLFFSKNCQKIEAVFQMPDNCCIPKRIQHCLLQYSSSLNICMWPRKVFPNSAYCTCNTDFSSSASRVTSWGGATRECHSRDWVIRLRPKQDSLLAMIWFSLS